MFDYVQNEQKIRIPTLLGTEKGFIEDVVMENLIIAFCAKQRKTQNNIAFIQVLEYNIR